MIAAYTRVSTVLQAEANGTAAQRAAIERWLDGKGARWFEDAGISGKSTDRPQWQALLAAVRAGEVDTVVVYSFTRASRSLADLSAWVKEMVKRGVRVVSIKEQVDVSTPTGRLMVNLIGCIGEWEREMTAEKASDGIRAKVAAGEKWGGARQFVNKRGTTEGCRKLTDAQWGEVRAKREAGATWAALAAEYRMHPNGVRYGLKRRANLSLGS